MQRRRKYPRGGVVAAAAMAAAALAMSAMSATSAMPGAAAAAGDRASAAPEAVLVATPRETSPAAPVATPRDATPAAPVATAGEASPAATPRAAPPAAAVATPRLTPPALAAPTPRATPPAATSAVAPRPTGPAAAIESSVVRVLVYANPPDFFSPWQKAGTQASSGSGVIIDGNRILTNAHVVADAVGIEVKRAGSGEQFEAAVSFVGHDCDLALLTVADEHFFEGVRPLSLGELPAVNEDVQTYGFPVGGETLSVTSGVISRIEVGTYAHSKERLLVAQIDAPINPGNSGGPVVRDGTVVGISMQMLEQAQNVGYMVPAPVVRHFLEDVDDANYDGVPRLGARLQPLESPALRASIGLAPRQTGGLVTSIDYGSSAQGVLQRGDVVVSVGGYPVAGDLTVSMPGNGRVSLDAVVGAQQVGATLELSILRGGVAQDVATRLVRSPPLVPGRRVGEEPEYLVFGGAVFQPLTGEYFELFEGLPPKLAMYADGHKVVTSERRQVVILSAVLPDPIARGYLDWESVVVRSVDGVVPRDLAHLAELVDRATGHWLRVESEDGSLMTLDVQAARDASPRILRKYDIPQDRSANLRSSGDGGPRAGS